MKNGNIINNNARNSRKLSIQRRASIFGNDLAKIT